MTTEEQKYEKKERERLSMQEADESRMDWLCQCSAGEWEELQNIRLAHKRGYLREAVDAARKAPEPKFDVIERPNVDLSHTPPKAQ